jgi:hypothetical protein
VPLQNDSELEWNESLVLSLGTPVNAILDPARIVHTLIINDDERAVSFTTSQVSTTEGVTASVIVALSGRVPEALTIPLIWTYASAVAVDVGSLRPPSRFPPRHRLPR